MHARSRLDSTRGVPGVAHCKTTSVHRRGFEWCRAVRGGAVWQGGVLQGPCDTRQPCVTLRHVTSSQGRVVMWSIPQFRFTLETQSVRKDQWVQYLLTYSQTQNTRVFIVIYFHKYFVWNRSPFYCKFYVTVIASAADKNNEMSRRPDMPLDSTHP